MRKSVISFSILAIVLAVAASFAMATAASQQKTRLLVVTNLPQAQADALRQDPQFYATLGAKTYFAGEKDNAAKLYAQALELDPSNKRALLGLSIIAHDDKDYVAAIGYLETLIAIDAQSPYYHYDLAINLADQVRETGKGDLERAKREFSTADTLSPGFAHAQENIAVLTRVQESAAD